MIFLRDLQVWLCRDDFNLSCKLILILLYCSWAMRFWASGLTKSLRLGLLNLLCLGLLCLTRGLSLLCLDNLGECLDVFGECLDALDVCLVIVTDITGYSSINYIFMAYLTY